MIPHVLSRPEDLAHPTKVKDHFKKIINSFIFGALRYKPGLVGTKLHTSLKLIQL